MSFTLLFDMDGLMLDTERLSMHAWYLTQQESGIALSKDVLWKMRGRTISDIRVLLRDVLDSPSLADQLLTHCDRHYRSMLDTEPPLVKPGLFALLDFLEHRCITKAVVTSSTFEDAQRKLSSTDLVHRFECVVTGDQVEKGKPAPDLFLEAAQRLGKEPCQCLVLEDSPYGIQAAYRAGMPSILVPDGYQPSPDVVSMSGAVFPSLVDVLQLLRAANGTLPKF